MPRFFNSLRLFCAIAVLPVLGIAGIANATVIVGAGQGNSGDALAFGSGVSQVASATWVQFFNYSDVNISAEVWSVNSGQSATAYLTTAIGPGAGVPIAEATVPVSQYTVSPSPIVTPVTLFSGLTLDQGTYYVTLFNPDGTGVFFNDLWSYTDDTAGFGVYNIGHYVSQNPNTTSPWQSTFTMSDFDSGFTLGLTVTGTVPEPSSVVLLGIAGMGLIGLVRRRRRTP